LLHRRLEIVTLKEICLDQTALLICDVYNNHWCKSQTKIYDVIAQRIGRVVTEFHQKGILVVHCPSECTDHYAATIQYQRMLEFLPLPPPVHKKDVPAPDPPITSKFQCMCTPFCEVQFTWNREHPCIPIAEQDIICDQGAPICSYLQKQGITTLFYAGFALNMCMLNRTFGIPQMLRWGMDCILIRDLTEVFYNPKDPPYVTRFRALQMMTTYVENTYCPSVTSEELVQGLNEH